MVNFQAPEKNSNRYKTLRKYVENHKWTWQVRK